MRYVTLCLCIAIMVSCKTKNKQLAQAKFPETAIALDIYLGQTDNEWERNVSTYTLSGLFSQYTEGGITYHHYYWSFVDTIALVDIVFNGGGHYNHGTLKTMIVYLAADKYKDVAANDESFVSTTEEGFRGNKYCSVGKYRKIKQYLDTRFGMPDAKRENNDATHYEYHRPHYTIILESSGYLKPTRGVKDDHYANATLSISLDELFS